MAKHWGRICRCGRYAEALEAFSCALALDPNDADAYFDRAQVYFDRKEYPQAVADLRRAIDFGSDPYFEISGRECRIECYFTLKEYQQALDDAHYLIQHALEELKRQRIGRGSEREWEYLQSHKYLTRGKAYAGLGNYREAIADFNRAEDIHTVRDPRKEYLAIHYHRGNAYLALGMCQKAFSDLNIALTNFETENWYQGISISFDNLNALQYEINEEILRTNWEAACRCREEGDASGGQEEEGVSEDKFRKRWWQFWK
jgi:tetratricopeptide (TPR) repeat protein